jgi:hypothetical protein
LTLAKSLEGWAGRGKSKKLQGGSKWKARSQRGKIKKMLKEIKWSNLSPPTDLNILFFPGICQHLFFYHIAFEEANNTQYTCCPEVRRRVQIEFD